MPRSIAILGMDPASRDLVNTIPEETEIWALNAAHKYLSRKADRWFQIHGREESGEFDMQAGPNDNIEHQNFLQTFEGPVYTVEVDPLIPTSVRYPMEEMVKKYGDYFTSTPCYLLALAISELKKGDTLVLIGVSMGEGIEYVQQKAGVEYFLGIARGRGIHLSLPSNTALLKSPLYGRGPEWAAYEKLNNRYLGLTLKKDQVAAELVKLTTQLEECEYSMMITTGMQPPQLKAHSQIIYRAGGEQRPVVSPNGASPESVPEPEPGTESEPAPIEG